MRKIIIALICALCAMCAKATIPDTTLAVGQVYEGGCIESISINDHFAVVYKNHSSFSLPLADSVVVNGYYYIHRGEGRGSRSGHGNYPDVGGSISDNTYSGHYCLCHMDNIVVPTTSNSFYKTKHV